MNPDFAFYYPGQYWRHPDKIKNLILFFDGIAMLIPEYMSDHGRFEDYPVIESLRDHDMFQTIRPEETVGPKETEILVESMVDIIASGRLDNLTKTASSFGSLSMSRLGFGGNKELAEFMFIELKDRGLASDSEDGVSIPMHRTVRTLGCVCKPKQRS